MLKSTPQVLVLSVVLCACTLRTVRMSFLDTHLSLPILKVSTQALYNNTSKKNKQDLDFTGPYLVTKKKPSPKKSLENVSIRDPLGEGASGAHCQDF